MKVSFSLEMEHILHFTKYNKRHAFYPLWVRVCQCAYEHTCLILLFFFMVTTLVSVFIINSGLLYLELSLEKSGELEHSYGLAGSIRVCFCMVEAGSSNPGLPYSSCREEANSDSMLELFLWLAFHCFCYYNHTEWPASENPAPPQLLKCLCSKNRKPRDKFMHLWTPYVWQRRQEYTREKRQSLSQVVLGKLVSHL